MIFRQYLHHDPVAASYLLGCGGQSLCAVVDPVGDIEPYLETAAETGMAIKYVIDTHIHADHLSAGLALAKAVGAPYIAGASQPLGSVRDGDRFELGNVSLEVLQTPGHTPEHISLLVTDRTRAPEPWAILTGHTLMVGDLGRTELAASAEDGARALFQSIRRLNRLADYVEVYPGAYSGSVCGRSLSGKPSSTIGFERRYNHAFSIGDEASFVAAMTSEIPEPPERAAELRAANAALTLAPQA
jgi:glyoxylase-like metal-dependent hydrolase (beta-lactamase superfamily II)